MYLKALEIHGFKSFPDKTRLTFEKDITAIVGPNGSGKSNISDAILWVMGEQRSKALRGGKMEDVIFGGTQKRNQMGFAQVSLILDNRDRLLGVESDEVAITRRYYRNGDSAYSINNEQVRLRDINELLMDTGLGRDGYSIIGQGRIAEIISAKSGDRREIFEEASGISRFRYRKEEAERKLAKTDENLLRVQDKIDELELQLTPLKKQSENAVKFLELREEQKQAEVSAWMESLDRLGEQLKKATEELKTAEASRDEAKSQMDELYEDAEKMTEKIYDNDLKTEDLRTLLRQTETTASDCESSIAVLGANIENNEKSVERLMLDIAEQESQERSFREKIEEHNKKLQSSQLTKNAIEEELSALFATIRDSENQKGEHEKEFATLTERESAISEKLTHAKAVLDMILNSERELVNRKQICMDEQSVAKEKCRETESLLKEKRDELSKISDRIDELKNVISGYRLRETGRISNVQKFREKHTKLTIDVKSAESRMKILSDMEREFEGFSKAVKIVMRETERGLLKGVHGPVASLLTVPDDYALAVETAIGGAMQNIVVDTPEVGKTAIEMLKRKDGGRGTFMPISTMRGGVLNNAPKGDEGYVGIASELVKFDEKYRNIFENILGRTIVAESLSDAVAIAKKHDNKFRIVTIDGQMINAGGSMSGGSAVRGAGILSRANELKKLTETVDTLNAELSVCEGEYNQAERELANVKFELEVAQNESDEAQIEQNKLNSEILQYNMLAHSAEKNEATLAEEISTITQKLSENEAKKVELTSECETAENELSEVRKTAMGLSANRTEFEEMRRELDEKISLKREEKATVDAEIEATLGAVSQLNELCDNISNTKGDRSTVISEIDGKTEELKRELMERNLRLNEITNSADKLRQSVADSTKRRMEIEGQRTKCEKEAKEKNNELIDLERLVAKLEQKKVSVDMEEKQILDKLWDNYELSRSTAMSLRQPVENMTELQKKIAQLRRAISSLGTPNIGAIEEYERVKERYEFLTEQRDDVQKSKRELLKIINEITNEMKEIFIKQFNIINECFKKTFLELFGGGRASLILEDMDNVLDCGIEIKVQPPGKALSTISLMSGGEKAFVAIALYFSIIKVRPTPFCVMDEIEAALDDANVFRYAEYMRKLTSKTQFIAITHRRGTMESADVLYGVTMQEKGVSKILEMDVEEAEKALE